MNAALAHPVSRLLNHVGGFVGQLFIEINCALLGSSVRLLPFAKRRYVFLKSIQLLLRLSWVRVLSDPFPIVLFKNSKLAFASYHARAISRGMTIVQSTTNFALLTVGTLPSNIRR